MKRIPILAMSLAIAGAALSATVAAQAAPAKGTISGDVYLVMQSGDTKRGSGVTVFLLRQSPSLKQWVDSECPRRNVAILLLKIHGHFLADSLTTAFESGSRTKSDLYVKEKVALDFKLDTLEKQALNDLHETVAEAAADTIGSGVNAHYQFTDVSPGEYVLFGEWTIGDNHYAWWAPTTVSPGQTVRRDLDNSTEKHESIYCGAAPEGEKLGASEQPNG